MKLFTKLFLTIGGLIVAMALLLSLVLGYFVEKDVAEATTRMRRLIRKEQKELEVSETALLSRRLAAIKRDVDALLLLINDSPTLYEELSLKNIEQGWESASQLLAFAPEMGMIQVHNLKEKQSVVIFSGFSPLNPVSFVNIGEGLVWVILEESDQRSLFIGIPLPDAQGYYALVDYEDLHSALFSSLNEGKLKKSLLEAQQNLKKIYGELKDLNPDLLFKHSLSAGSSGPELTSEKAQGRWALEMRMIELLAPLFAEGLELYKNEKRLVPAGIALIKSEDSGVMLLSNKVFRIEPIFDDIAYFNEYPSESGLSSIAGGVKMVQDPTTNELFLGNTLKLNDTYITLGASLKNLVKGIAQSANRTVIFETKEGVKVGYTKEGKLLTNQQLSSFDTARNQENQEKGELSLLGTDYYFFQIPLEPSWQISAYVLTPLAKEMALIRTLVHVHEEIKQRILWQIIIVSCALLIIALFVLRRIARSIARPISHLATLTTRVSEGKLTDIDLPKMGNRSDEVALLTHSFGEMIQGLQDREKMRGVLNKVVSKDVADEILKTQLHLGGEDRLVTMLFSDIRSFTQHTENLAPQEIIEMLNTYMTLMSRVIEGEGGVIDKYVGDEIMALYGAPVPHPDHAIRALSSAKLMIETLKRWNEERIAQGKEPIEMGIGIHTGIVVAGNMGAEDRLNYTVLGAHVNLAARLCQVAKPMQILISENTLKQNQIEESFYVEPLEPIQLKGFSEPVKIYQITGFKWS